MFRLENVSLVNWYLFDPIDVPIGGNTVVLGENGSGKTSLLDAIQVVMVGNDGRFLSLNARSEQGRKDNKRSVKAYMLGVADDAEPRQSAYSYIALGFRQDLTGREVTIGVAMHVTADQESETIDKFFIVDGRILSKNDLSIVSGDIAVPIRWKDLRENLVADGLEPLTETKPTRFRQAYMEILNPGARGFASVDDGRYVRIFRQTLEFKVADITDVSQFMRNFVLPDRPLPLDIWREQHRSWMEYLTRIRAVEAEMAAVVAIAEQASTLHAAEAGLMAATWAKERIPHLTQLRKYREAVRELGVARAEKEKASVVVAGFSRRKAEAEQKLAEKIRVLETSDEALALARLDAQRTEAKGKLSVAEQKIGTYRNAFLAIPRLVRTAGELGLASRAAEDAAAALAVAGAGAGRQWIAGKDDYHRTLTELARAPFRNGIQSFRDNAIARLGPIQDQIGEIRRRLEVLGAGRSPLSRETIARIEELRANGIQATTLSSVADIRPGLEAWRAVAESILGDWCHAIIVPPENVEAAISIFRKGRYNEPLLRTNKIPLKLPEPRQNSLAYVVISDNPFARAYVQQQLGGIDRVETDAQLKDVDRGATSDGMYSTGYGVRRRRLSDVPDLFGRNPVGLGDALRSKMSNLENEGRKLLSDQTAADRLLYALDQALAAVPESLAEYMVAFEELEGLSRDLHDIEATIGDVQNKVDPGLRDEIAELQAYIAEADDEITKAKGEESDAHDRGIKLSGEVGQFLDGRKERLETLQRWRSAWRQMGVHAHIMSSGRMLLQEIRSKPGSVGQLLDEHRRRLEGQKTTAQQRFMKAYEAYMQAYPPKNIPPAIGHDILDISRNLKTWCADRLAALHDNELLPYREKAAVAAEMWLEKTRTDFLQQIRGRIQELTVIKNQLSNNLTRRKFNRSVYKISMESVPSMRPIIDLANNVESRSHKFTRGYLEANPDDPDVVAINGLMAMLTHQDDGDDALKRVIDYRNYYEFDLSIHDALTDREKSKFTKRAGSASGGERDVPFYICLGVAMAMTYFGRIDDPENANKSGIVLLDEAFGKLDPGNVAKIIDYYKSLGLQLICAAPSTNRAVYAQAMSRIINIAKVGDRVDLLPAGLTPEANELVRKANPSVEEAFADA